MSRYNSQLRKHNSRIRKLFRIEIHTWKELGAVISPNGQSILYYRKCIICGLEGTGVIFKAREEDLSRAKSIIIKQIRGRRKRNE